MGWTSPEAREIFRWLVKQEAERRSRNRKKVSEALKTVPACQETLNELGALSPEDAERALRTHPGYPANRKIESVRTMLELLHRALADLDAAIAEFPELGGPDDRSLHERLEKGISIRVNKELFAALGAAKTLVDYSRRVKDLMDATLFDAKLKDAFHPGEHALIMGLRNSVLHQVHFRANWQKRWRAGTKTTHFVIQTEDLQAEGELSSAAREHLNRFGTTCDVTELLRGYSEKVDQFYTWLLTEVESHLPLEVRRGELAGLQWGDFDFKNLHVSVTRSLVDQHVGPVKTEASRKLMPIDEYVARDLLAWYDITPYKNPSDYVWATDANRAGAKRGKQPVWLSTVMRDHIQPVARKLGITKKISWSR